MNAMLLPMRAGRSAVLLALAAVLAACASGPTENISLIPAQTAEQTSKDGLFTQPIKWERGKPGCKGECPKLELDSIIFPGVPRLTELIDHALATMTDIAGNSAAPYSTIAGYEDYFWKTAAARDSTLLSARTRYRNRHITLVELNSWMYKTGAAHGMSATQFLNWDNDHQKVLGMNDVLQNGARPAFEAALQRVHAQWLQNHPDAQRDPEGFRRVWPFQPSENFGLSDQGIVVKYDSYQIAPYSSGQPELLIPYDQLQGVLRPEYMPG
ncbi:RsiV family protein [Parapusillimonas sp. JC17]|uniref:RsiV family protein n=1 Tax=Parapusillimonas sp. JC17 TaxID=3445768 RepID=UPI003F9FDF34